MNAIDQLCELLRILSNERKKQLILFLIFAILGASAEILSISLLVPFLSILANPDKLSNYTILKIIFDFLDAKSIGNQTLFVTLIFAITACTSSLFRIFLLKFSTKLAFTCGADIGEKAYSRILMQNYTFHLSSNSSNIISILIDKVNTLVFGVIFPIIMLISSLIFIAIISAGLMYIDFSTISVSIVIFGSSYIIIYFIIGKRLNFNSKVIASEQSRVIKTIQESIGGIRDVIIEKNQKFFYELFCRSDTFIRKAQASNSFISGSPRYLIEGLAMLFVAVLAFYKSNTPDGIMGSLPSLAVFAIGTQRILPSLQQSYNAWAGIMGNLDSLREVILILNLPVDNNCNEENYKQIEFNGSIKFENVSFSYQNNIKSTLNSINLEIPKGATVGITGPTGSGKSTLIDLILGLISSSSGAIKIDDTTLNNTNIGSWRRLVAHVPQNIFLLDATITENITFGSKSNDIDYKRLIDSAKSAQLVDFINSRPLKYDTRIGERGSLLSGGQRQRIGIARALYKESHLLVLDEATSALDTETENLILDSLRNNNKNTTVIMITHRKATLINCDIIIYMNNGELTAFYSYGDFQDFISTKES